MGAYACTFLMDMAMVMVMVGMPYLAIDRFGAGAGELGLLGGVSGICYVGVCFISGPLANRFGRRKLLGAGLVLVIGASVGLGAAWSIGCLMALSGVLGLGQGLFWPALETVIGRGVGPGELKHRMGWFNLSWSSADIAGTLAGGGIYTLARQVSLGRGWTWMEAAPFYVAAGMGVAVLVMVMRGTPSVRRWTEKEQRQEGDEARGGGGRRVAALVGVFWVMALAANSAATGFRTMLINVFPDMGTSVFHYSAAEWGILLAMTPLVRTVMFTWLWKHGGWTYKARYLFGFQALLPAAAVLLIVGTSYWVFMAAFALVGAGMSMTYYSSIYYSLDSDTAHGRRSGVHEGVIGTGTVFAPPLAGMAAWASGNMRSPYMLMLALLVLGMGAQVMMLVRRRGGTDQCKSAIGQCKMKNE